MRLLLADGIVVGGDGKERAADVLVEDGRITAVGKDLHREGSEGKGKSGKSRLTVLDCSGCMVLPGLVDMHVHLRDPGREDEETVESGARAALAAGFTDVAAMANTTPVADTASVIEYVAAAARDARAARVHPVGALTKGLAGEQLAEMWDMAQAGAVAFSDDGRSIEEACIMRRAMEYAKGLAKPVLLHCEDMTLTEGGATNEGVAATRAGLPGMPAAAETVVIAREIELAGLTGTPVHIQHVSSARSLALIGEAKARGVPVTCEVTPHHLTLEDTACATYDTMMKVNPPLRGAEDRAVLVEGLARGTIDCVATDHAPHAAHEKELEFELAPFGMVGLESAVPVLVNELVGPGTLSWATLAERMAHGPRRVLGLPEVRLREGDPADITVVDPELAMPVGERWHSKSRNCPWWGKELRGWARHMIVGGEARLVDGVVHGKAKAAGPAAVVR